MEDNNETEVRRQQAAEQWERLANAHASGEIIESTVKSATKGGYIVALGPYRGFLPGSQARLGAAEEVAGKTIPVVIIDLDHQTKRGVVSHKQALDINRRRARTELLASLTLDSEHRATVVRLATFGAFVDLGGIDALVPIGELALERVENVSDVVKVGDAFPVRVLRVDGGGKKIAVSRKAALHDPWRDHADLLQRGKIVEGTVVANTTELQVELAPGVVGNISENEATPSDYVIGEKVEVSIRSADYRTRRLRLSTMHAAQSFSGGSFAPLGNELSR